MTAPQFSQRRIDTSMRVSEIGTGAMLLLVPIAALQAPFVFKAIVYIVLVGSIFTLYRNRRQDEFLLKHWNAGATAGFFAVCLWSTLAPFLLGLWKGLHNLPRGDGPTDDLMSVVLLVALFAFFIVFQVSRWRNR